MDLNNGMAGVLQKENVEDLILKAGATVRELVDAAISLGMVLDITSGLSGEATKQMTGDIPARIAYIKMLVESISNNVAIMEPNNIDKIITVK